MSNTVVEPSDANVVPASDAAALPDTQNERDTRGLAIQRVGIRGLRLPATILGADGSEQGTAATFELSVNLPHEQRGTHMSRFVELVQSWNRPWTASGFAEFMGGFHERFDCQSAFAKIEFPYFFPKTTPVSQRDTWSECQASYEGELHGNSVRIITTVTGAVKTLCPCSKAISAYGAHNQRGQARVSARGTPPVELGALIEAIERSGSSPLYPLLKRADEKAVTEMAYENPVFVEDLVRNIALKLREKPGIEAFEVEAENFESIHAHNAHALLRYPNQ